MGNCLRFRISNNKVATSPSSCSSLSSTNSVKTSKTETKVEETENELNIKKVCDYLSFEDVLKCRLVCKDWEGYIRLEYTRFAEAKVKFSPAVFLMKKKDISAFMINRIVPWRNVCMNFFPFPSKSSLFPYWESCGKFVRVLHLQTLSIECIELVRFLEACPALQDVTIQDIGFMPQFSKRGEEVKEKIPKKSSPKTRRHSSLINKYCKSKKSSSSQISSASEKAVSKRNNLTSSSNSTSTNSDVYKNIKKSQNTRSSSESNVSITAKGRKESEISQENKKASSNESTVISNLSAKVKKLLAEEKSKRTSSSSTSTKSSENKSSTKSISKKNESKSTKASDSDSSTSSSSDEENETFRTKSKIYVESPGCKWDSTTITFCPHISLPGDFYSINKSQLVSVTLKNQIIIPLCLLDYLSQRSRAGSLQNIVYQDNTHISSTNRNYMKEFITPNSKSVESEFEMVMMLRGDTLKSLTIAHTEILGPFETELEILEKLTLKSKNSALCYDYLGFDDEIKLLNRYKGYNIRILDIAFYNPEKQKLEGILADCGKKNILEKLRIVLTKGRINLTRMLQNLTQLKDLEIVEKPYYENGEQEFGTERGFDLLFLNELPKSLMSLSIQLSYRGYVLKELIFAKSNSFDNLKQLKITYCDFDDEMFQEILEHCFFLEVLHVCDSKILSDPGITGLTRETCVAFRGLIRSHPTFEAKNFKTALLKHLKREEELKRITGEEELPTETEVEEEVPAETEVEEELPSEKNKISIKNLKNLKILNLSGCPYVSELSIAFGIQSKSLKVLILADCNQVRSGGIQFALENNPNLQRLVINNVIITHQQISDIVIHNKKLQKIHLGEKKRKECLDCAKGARRVLLSNILTSKPPSLSDISQEYVESVQIVPSRLPVSLKLPKYKKRKAKPGMSSTSSSCNDSLF